MLGTLLVVLAGCRSNTPPETTCNDSLPNEDVLLEADSGYIDSIFNEPASPEKKVRNSIEFYGDTVFTYSYGVKSWFDTLNKKDFSANLSVWIDTTDFIIDTVRSARGNRIVIGYNHYYSIELVKNEGQWFSLNFNKREDMEPVLSSTDFWVESNLNVFHNVLYNKRYNTFIAEFDINTRNYLSSLYYIVFRAPGNIAYIGAANSWGGGNADGDPFITADGRMYVSCTEIYNFETATAMPISEFATLAEYRSGEPDKNSYQQTHAIRRLGNNSFLVVFYRFHDDPLHNALILNTDTMLLGRFSYHGLIDEMDAVLLYQQIDKIGKSFILDTERESLVILNTTDSFRLREVALQRIPELPKDSLKGEGYYLIDYGIYSASKFYYADENKPVYRKDYELN